jgi:hypothetical protein
MSILNKPRLLRLAVCTLLASGAFGVQLKSYTTVGHKWGTNQVNYYVNPQNIYMSDSAATSAFQIAAAAWHDQTNANIQLVYAGVTNGSSLTLNNKNEMFFRNDSGGNIADTYWWYDGTGKLVDADVVLHENYAYSTGSGCSNGIYVEDVAIHEFGHVLGLAHSETFGATMYGAMPGYCDTTQLTLEADDIAGIRSLYPPSSSSQPPAAPSQLAVATASANPSSSLALSWADNANSESSYLVERSPNGTSFGLIAQLGVNATSFTDSALAGATVYYYRVSAANAYGNSAYSNVASGQTQAASVNTAPVVSIVNPSNNASYPSGVSMTFSGSAADTPDGNLTSSVKWTSSLDGQIGTGGSFSRTLSVGTHVITATVTDAGGLVGSRQVSVTVTAAPSPSGPTLTARGYKVKGMQKADLTWSGLSSTSVDVYRGGAKISTSANDGKETDNIDKKGTGSYSYKVCVAGSVVTCTNSVSVTF